MAIRLSREERAASSNRGADKLPTLSPAFIKEADAAYWAHLHIGERRDVEYGGVILRDSAGLYFATYPFQSGAMQFDLRDILAVGADGYYQQPRGYTCVASYHSHPAQHALIMSRNPSFDERMTKAFLGFFSGTDFYSDVHDRDFFPSAYLSGPDGSLIRHAPSGSRAEFSFALWVQAGKPANNPVGVYGPFDEFIKKVASFGSLSFIVPTEWWGGSVGRVPTDWVVFEPFTSAEVTEQPLCSSVYDQAELAVMAALPSPAPEGQVGFVLKHLTQERYVATLASPRRIPLFALDGVFPKAADGTPQLLADYRLEAIYFSAWNVKEEVSALEGWLASAFFSPAQMVAAIQQGQSTEALHAPSRGLDLYMRALDNTLLQLNVPSAALSTELFKRASDGTINDNGAQAELAAGTLSPRNFVRRVIDATPLWVVQSGGLWREVGRVDNRSALLSALYSATLSHGFFSARDAAVYAHEQIGHQRSFYYGGYVLKGTDGRFVITQPLESVVHPFASTLFFPVNEPGPLIPPESYELHARYGSHTALSMVDPDWVAQRGWSRDEALINVQVFSTEEMYSIIQDRRVAYLSGAEDCLLEYTPNQSPEEALLLANLGPQAGENSLGRRLDRAEIRPDDWVRRLAVAGELKIIQGNALWGPRSVVYSDWSANFTYAPRSGAPDYVTYGGIFASPDEAARDLQGRVQGRRLPEQACFAFILKHKSRAQFIATEVVGARSEDSLFKLGSLFPRVHRRDLYQLPEGFELHALFRSQQWSPHWLAGASGWLTQHFVMPDVLLASLTQALEDRETGLAIYFSMLDGALLRYTPSPINVKKGGVADQLLGEARTQLTSGAKTPQTFIRDWAARGDLQVVRVSQYWDKAGLVGTAWNGYGHIAPRRLTPCFAFADDAARHAQALVGNGHKRTYGGVILQLLNGLFVATEPLLIPPQGATLSWVYPDATIATGLYPGGSTLVASYRSLPEREVPILLSPRQKAVYQSMIPTEVLAHLLRQTTEIKRQYVFGPTGSILSYRLSDSIDEAQLKKSLNLNGRYTGDFVDNFAEQKMRTQALLPQDFVESVVRAGELRVVQGDTLWGSPRLLRPRFALNPYPAKPWEVISTAADSPCGPMFTRAMDAMRYVQRRWQPQARVAVGYVLKAFGRELYMATQPLLRDSHENLRAIFRDGQVPQGYSIAGVYLCASTETIAAADDAMAKHFFAPAKIAKALEFMTTPRNGNTLPLYLLCADGALLGYTVPKAASVSERLSKVSHDTTQLHDGTLTVRDYVGKLAEIGELKIRLTSEIWGRKERVTAQWQPKRPPHSFTSDPYFHSFCGPLFFFADDAARYAQQLIAPFHAKTYLGALLEPPRLKGFVAIDPVEDRPGFGNSTLEWFFWPGRAGFDVPANNDLHDYKIAAVHAFFKSIPYTSSLKPLDISLLPNFVSSQDLNSYLSVHISNLPDAQCIYLSCRGGGLLKYVPAVSSAESTLLSARPAPAPSALVSHLCRLGSLSVLITDTFWKRRGVLGGEWATVSGEAGEPWYGRAKDEL
ncbi:MULTISPECIES: DUF4329 domain-containing protein [Pseudomonas]|uniref:DUF4329 domain-containing protein n=1 Tax=Pseudomonas fluorescens LMG 5329 TaxID=1324332 RepID=A0A0A1Z9C3_PSEFL|nr:MULTISPECIES: DUF4329 domain-containing protein [Pseudomonas]KGE69407.1 hypothetical protein K814_0103145 [Pseudomonas fluorescens LMG 5329]NWE01857.1 DUF4329 domain-containing protein [Pseudomonas sp. IPO3749]NWF24010.1 DUF4329 domain-containing protein [Pseudomonas sp. IPO3749]